MTVDGAILLVEDDAAAVELARHAFRKSALPNRIEVAADGQAALDYLGAAVESGAAGVPRMILLDLKLPKVDGLEVLRRIRGEPGLKQVPVIILTSSENEDDIVRGYDLGANSYLRKPVNFEQLVSVSRQLGLLPG